MADWVWFFWNLVFTMPPMIRSGWKTGSYSMHIQTNTLHTSRSPPIKLLGGGPSWKGGAIPYSLFPGWKSGGTKHPLNHCKVQIPPPRASSLVTTGTLRCTALLNTCPQSHLFMHGPLVSIVNYICMSEYFQINLSVFCVFTATSWSCIAVALFPSFSFREPGNETGIARDESWHLCCLTLPSNHYSYWYYSYEYYS